MRVHYPKCAYGPYCWSNQIENGVYTLVEVSFYIPILGQKKNLIEISKKQRDNTKTTPKFSITQRLRTDLGRSVGVTTATKLVLLNRFYGIQTFPLTAKVVKQNDTNLKCVNNAPYMRSFVKMRHKIPLIKYIKINPLWVEHSLCSIGISTIYWYAMPSTYTNMFSLRKVNASYHSAQVQLL